MASFLEIQKKAQSLTPQKVRNDLFLFVRTLEKYLANLNVEQLNKNSEDIFGNPIGFYSPATEFITTHNALLGRGNKIKKAGDPFDLEDTGDFLGGVFAQVDKGSIFFDTTDSKKNDVLDNLLSKRIFGLTDQNLNKVINEKLLPFFINYYRKNLFG